MTTSVTDDPPLFLSKPRSNVVREKGYRYLGVRNVCLNRITEQWQYLLFWETDTTDIKYDVTDAFRGMSYICYSTKHGAHWVGLTPLEPNRWGERFQQLRDNSYNHKYAGQTIRLSRKRDEKQRLLHYNFQYKTIMNLYQVYQKRFNITETPMHSLNDYACIYEWYRSKKN